MGLWGCELVRVWVSVLRVSVCVFTCLRVYVCVRAVCFCVIVCDCMFVDLWIC